MAKKRMRLPLPKLTQGWKTVRNLAVVLICLYALWARAGYPLPTAEMEFRRLERENLLGRSEIQGTCRDNDRHWVAFGVQGDKVVMGGRYGLSFWPRAENGPTLMPIEEFSMMAKEMRIIAADVPEGTASARLDMTIRCWFASQPGGSTSISAVEGGWPQNNSLIWEEWTRDYQAEGELLKGGGVLFCVPRGDAEDTVSLERELFWMLARHNTFLRSSDAVRGGNCRMEAVFYDETGAELSRAALSTPEGGKSDAS